MQSSGSDAVAYEGATVLEAKVSCRDYPHAELTLASFFNKILPHDFNYNPFLDRERVDMVSSVFVSTLRHISPPTLSLRRYCNLMFKLPLVWMPRWATTATRWQPWTSRRCTPAS